MCCCHNKWCKFVKLLIVGLVIVIVAMMTQSVLNVLIAIGILIIIKAIVVAVMPQCTCETEDKPKKKR